MKAVILAGGKGTRLAPYTTVLPKPLMPIGDVPILDVVLRQLAHYGFTQVILAVGHLSELIRAYCADGKRYGLVIEYSNEEMPLGTAGPLSLIEGLNEPFLVMNGDLLTTLDFGTLWRSHVDGGQIATVATFKKDVRIDLGVIEYDAEMRVTGYIEKPTYHYAVSSGIYIFDPAVREFLTPGEHMDLPELILELMARKKEVRCHAYEGYWLDIGRHEDYAQAMEAFEARRSEFLPDEG